MPGATIPPKISPKTYRIGTAACKHFKRTLVNSNWLKEKKIELYN